LSVASLPVIPGMPGILPCLPAHGLSCLVPFLPYSAWYAGVPKISSLENGQAELNALREQGIFSRFHSDFKASNQGTSSLRLRMGIALRVLYLSLSSRRLGFFITYRRLHCAASSPPSDSTFRSLSRKKHIRIRSYRRDRREIDEYMVSMPQPSGPKARSNVMSSQFQGLVLSSYGSDLSFLILQIQIIQS